MPLEKYICSSAISQYVVLSTKVVVSTAVVTPFSNKLQSMLYFKNPSGAWSKTALPENKMSSVRRKSSVTSTFELYVPCISNSPPRLKTSDEAESKATVDIFSVAFNPYRPLSRLEIPGSVNVKVVV